MLNFEIIVAIDEESGIGKNGTLPWHLPADLKHFKDITTSSVTGKQNAVIMGRRTWDSLPEKFRPLPQRLNVVLTRQKNMVFPKGVLVAESLDEALNALSQKIISDKIDKVFVIGGEQVFRSAVVHPACQKIHLTHILKKFACDTFFPPFQDRFKLSNSTQTFQDESKDISFCFAEYVRIVS